MFSSTKIFSKQFETIDCHCCGEPARVVVSGLENVHGVTMAEKRTYLMENMDYIRKILLLEPRGYPCQNADIVFKSQHKEAEWGFVILEQGKIYPAMSGHNTICVVTALIETGRIPMQDPLTQFKVEVPGGLIDIRAVCDSKKNKVTSVTFRNVPSFVQHLGVSVSVPEIGNVMVDIAFAGMWYAVVDATSLSLEITPQNGKKICRLGEMIKTAAREQYPVNHPIFDYAGCDILVFRSPPSPNSGAHAKNAVVMSNGILDWKNEETWTGMIDRSPCGTGTCAVMTVMHARGELKLGEEFIHESIVGTIFKGKLIEEIEIFNEKNKNIKTEPIRCVIPEISGSAWITQFCKVVVEEDDPFPEGFTVSDIWSA